MEPSAAPPPGLSAPDDTAWSTRWRAWRDRLLANPRFQRWASGFPLTRPMAQRRSRQLFDLLAGFVYSQVLLACVRLRLFDLLADGPQPLARLAESSGLGDDAMRRLLAAAVSLRLVERRGEATYGLGVLGAPLVGHGALTAMIEHHGMFYRDLADPLALLRGQRAGVALADFWPYARSDVPAGLDDARVTAYSALMSASQPLVAEQVLDAYPLARHRCLLDVGGGEGGFLCAAARRAPQLRLVLVDLPPVAERARARFAREGLAARAEAIGGDFLRAPLPRGADIVSLVRIVHDHDDAAVRRLLRAAHAALPPGGTLLLAEPFAGTPGAEPVGDAYFGFYLLAMGSGRARTRAELTTLLLEAGFEAVRPLRTRMPLQASLLVARVGHRLV
jgi:demethylspheroidene O-methyltransferase